eukprot:CAMPEP_0201574506 /NCGR_PEP_ID=MMETSP0190_2-20130828/19023_1 /ASSEMBLY_ACC=CAM_ASM_000263 /TAXON_ID=37353 /ORGANISM="Rosalina sp." /LENGTH=299 /DNA_ID=CAMNT_0048002827 /DNA_START=119 /DNA_END=1019 /DNA_ORIENTATION=-
MIRKILFAILLAHSALIAQGKPSRIILQAPPPNPQVPAQVAPQVPPGELPQVPPQVPGLTIPPPQIPAPIPPVTTTAPQAPATTIGASTVTNALGSPAPVTGAPGTTIAATSSPGTNAPNTDSVAPAPGTTVAPAVVTPLVIPVVVTPAPVTPPPTTPVPTTRAPTTAAPTTAAPTTAAPTLPPLPSGYEYGAWNQVCPVPTSEQDCQFNGQMIQSDAVNNRGIINCDRTADCCKCGSIQCGVVSPVAGLPLVDPHGCLQFSAGDYGAYGVKQIVVIGNPASGAGGASIVVLEDQVVKL